MNLIQALQFGGTPLHFAEFKNNIAVAGLLLRSGAVVNAKDKVRTT